MTVETTETTGTAAPTTSVREAAIAAAIAAEAEFAPAESGDEGDSGEVEAVEASPAPQAAPSKLQAEIRAREDARAAQREADALRAERQEFERQRAEFLRERDAYAPKLDALKRLDKEPSKALADLGVKYDELTREVVEEGTPDAAIRRLHAKLEAQERQFSEYLQRQQQAAQQAAMQESHRTFMATALSDAYPTLKTLYADDPQELIEVAYRAQSKLVSDLKRDPTREEIAEWLEKRYARINGAPQVERRAGNATSGATATGSRTLSAADASRKATAPIPFEKMTADQKRRAAIKAAEEAERSYEAKRAEKTA